MICKTCPMILVCKEISFIRLFMSQRCKVWREDRGMEIQCKYQCGCLKLPHGLSLLTAQENAKPLTSFGFLLDKFHLVFGWVQCSVRQMKSNIGQTHNYYENLVCDWRNYLKEKFMIKSPPVRYLSIIYIGIVIFTKIGGDTSHTHKHTHTHSHTHTPHTHTHTHTHTTHHTHTHTTHPHTHPHTTYTHTTQTRFSDTNICITPESICMSIVVLKRNGLTFIAQRESVYCAVRTSSLNIIHVNLIREQR